MPNIKKSTGTFMKYIYTNKSNIFKSSLSSWEYVKYIHFSTLCPPFSHTHLSVYYKMQKTKKKKLEPLST